ncbi:radical SAM protein [Fodinisporobacter ferrooxydans]|uniref:Radical SAM protein n=1 Tax=Fodinisporobacter ferrooxydans TaxID=2901836 RepID=A0ABY4CUN8_9BACL|nr:radical SAM protein [Alicyclobacillaceae bacterium MYW30-H2]
MYTVYADLDGNIYDDPDLLALGRTADQLTDIMEDELIPLPEGATLVSLPGTSVIGVDKTSNETRRLPDTYHAVGALLPQGFTRLLLPGYVKQKDVEPFPLFGYTAVVWKDNQFYVAAKCSDEPQKWNPLNFPENEVERTVAEMRASYPNNRLYEHLSHCALVYGCLTSQNTFFRRWEGALPVSSTCNAGCVGCISEQPDDSVFPSPQTRMTFAPTVDEMVEVMVNHLQNEDSIISFGQGCEGEPSTRGREIAEAIRRTRAITAKGFININTNAGLTEQIKRIVDAGLDLIRVSTISAIPDHYNAYYRPRKYGVDDVAASLRYASDHGVYTSINYLIFPGVTDREEEIEAMVAFIRKTGVRLIQLRNLNIDPEYYLAHIPPTKSEILGMNTMMEIFKEECPDVVLGSFTHVPPGMRKRV